jgi:aubergine-like protein
MEEKKRVLSSQSEKSEKKQKIMLKGLMGKPIKLKTNYFKISFQCPTLFQYSLKIEPLVENRILISGLLHSKEKEIGSFVYDGNCLYLQKNIGNSLTLDCISKNTKKEFKIFLNKVDEISRYSGEKLEQVYNIVFKKLLRCLKLKEFGVGRGYFNMKREKLLERQNLSIIPGIKVSIKNYENNILLNSELTFKVLQNGNVLDYIKDLGRNRKSKNEIRNEISGAIVMTRYNNRTYRIDDVDYEQNPRSSFTLKKTGKPISYMEYYGIINQKIRDDNQPLLVVREKKRGSQEEKKIYLIPELCTLTGISDSVRKDYKTMNEIHKTTKPQSKERIKELEEFVKEFETPKNLDLKEETKKWNISINSKMIEVPGRIFNPENIKFGNIDLTKNQKREANWNKFYIENPIFVEAKHIQDWLVLFHEKDYNVVNSFIDELISVAFPFGIKMNKPKKIDLRSDKESDYIKGIKDNFKSKDLIICVLPRNIEYLYGAIKKVLTTEIPIPSQCVVVNTINNRGKLKSVCTNIIQQINSKLGGKLWRLDIPILTFTMICGIDVGPHKKHKGESVVSFTASLDKDYISYYSNAIITKNISGVANCLQIFLKEALDIFKKKKRFFSKKNYNLS